MLSLLNKKILKKTEKDLADFHNAMATFETGDPYGILYKTEYQKKQRELLHVLLLNSQNIR